MFRISWIDSARLPSHIHLTADGKQTLCDEAPETVKRFKALGLGLPSHAKYIEGRKLAKAPIRIQGRSQYCKECYKELGRRQGKHDHSQPWDPRCKDVTWEGPGFPTAKEEDQI
jgi:hypothetical protein